MSTLKPIVTGPIGRQPGQTAEALFPDQFRESAQRDRSVEQAQRDAYVGNGVPGDARVPGAGR